MADQPSSPAKSCSVCGQDCSNKPRVKDAKGAYVCRECAAKLQAGAAPQAAASRPPAKPAGKPDPDDMMAKLVDDSIAKAAVSCPTCRKPWKSGAVICTHCGYNKQTSQLMQTAIKDPAIVAAPKTIGGKGKRAGGGKKFAGAHWKIAVVLAVLYIAGLGMALSDNEFAAIFILGTNLYMFLYGVFAAADAYMESESALKAIFVFFCGIYGIYYGCVETDNDLLKGTAWAYVLVILLRIVAIAVMGVAMAGGMGFGAPAGGGG